MSHDGKKIALVTAGVAMWASGCAIADPRCLSQDYPELAFNLETDMEPPVIEEKPSFESGPIFTEIAGRTGSHASCVLALDDGELLAVWYSYGGPHELEQSAVYLSRRAAGGTAWSAPELLVDGPAGDGNPVIYAEGDRVWLFHAVVPFGWATARVEVQTSENRGRTWGRPRWVGTPVGINVRNKPLRLGDGQLLLPCYDEIVPRSVFFASGGGDTWRLRGEAGPFPPNLQPAVVQLDAGRLLAVMRNPARGDMWVMYSDDGGKCWSPPGPSGFANPGSACDLLKLADGHLVLAFNDSPTSRSPLTVALSIDEGRTWPFRRDVAESDREVSYPSLTQTPDGTIHLTYTYRRERIEHAAFNEAWIAAND